MEASTGIPNKQSHSQHHLGTVRTYTVRILSSSPVANLTIVFVPSLSVGCNPRCSIQPKPLLFILDNAETLTLPKSRNMATTAEEVRCTFHGRTLSRVTRTMVSILIPTNAVVVVYLPLPSRIPNVLIYTVQSPRQRRLTGRQRHASDRALHLRDSPRRSQSRLL